MTVNQARRLRLMARWHRRVAVFMAAWLTVLAASGILINHANDWGLDSRPLAEPLQRLVYGIETSGNRYCETAPATGDECRDIFARLEIPSGAVLLGINSLFVTDASGHVVERLPAAMAGLNSLDAAYAIGPDIFLRDATRTVRTGPDLLDFSPVSTVESASLDDVSWQERPPSTETITWERLLLDLHAARFLGPLSKAFNDLAAGLILLLALSGAWLYRLKRRGDGN